MEDILKKDIKVFIQAIRNRNNDTFDEMLSDTPELLSVTATRPPNKDDGQSPLQISFKTGNLYAAGVLIDKGANLNFMEESDVNEWRTPVLHDAIRATLFTSYTLESDDSKFNHVIELLEKMLKNGADPKGVDSYGNNGCLRAVLDANQMIDHPDSNIKNGKVINQITQVFSLLSKYGGDFDESTETRSSAKDMLINFRLEKYNLLPI